MKIKRTFGLKWHRRVGIIAAVFLLVIALTGVLLNHARSLGLHELYVDNSWVLSAYDMQLPPDYIIAVERGDKHTRIITQDGTLTVGLEQDVEAMAAKYYRGEGVVLEKLLLDIHSGQIIGLSGKVISDLAALAMIFLSISGILNASRRKRK